MRTSGTSGLPNPKVEELAKEKFESIKKRATQFKHIPRPKPLKAPSLVSKLAREAQLQLSAPGKLLAGDDALKSSNVEDQDSPAVFSIVQALTFAAKLVPCKHAFELCMLGTFKIFSSCFQLKKRNLFVTCATTKRLPLFRQCRKHWLWSLLHFLEAC